MNLFNSSFLKSYHICQDHGIGAFGAFLRNLVRFSAPKNPNDPLDIRMGAINFNVSVAGKMIRDTFIPIGITEAGLLRVFRVDSKEPVNLL